MARVNIDDSIYRDGRFLQLVAKSRSPEEAIGCLVMAWSVAQKWFTKPEKFIPIEEWKKQRLSDAIIECGLADLVNGFVKMRGINDQFNWLTQRVEAGRKGGFAKRKRKASKPVATAERPLDPAKRPPSLLTPYSNTTTNTKKKNNINTNYVVKRVSFDFDALYKKYPRKLGRQKGLRIAQDQIKTPDDYNALDLAITRYGEHCRLNSTAPEFIKYFSTFMSEWKDWIDVEICDESKIPKDVSAARLLKVLEEHDLKKGGQNGTR